jgi:hypothetical protein
MSKKKYAATGYVVSKIVLPIVRRRMKKKARASVVNTGKRGAEAARNNPARTSIAVGSIIGAGAFLLRRKKHRRIDRDD